MVDDDALVVIGHSRAVAFTLHQSDVVQEERLGDDDVRQQHTSFFLFFPA